METYAFPGYDLHEGSNGESVGALKAWLNEIRGKYHSIPLISVASNIFDAETEAAVKAFQRAFNLAADGLVSRATWHKIAQVREGLAKFGQAPNADNGARGLSVSDGDCEPNKYPGNDINLSGSWLKPMFYEDDFLGETISSILPATPVTPVTAATPAVPATGVESDAEKRPDATPPRPEVFSVDAPLPGNEVEFSMLGTEETAKPVQAPAANPVQKPVVNITAAPCKPCQSNKVKANTVSAVNNLPEELFYYQNNVNQTGLYNYQPYPVVQDYTAPQGAANNGFLSANFGYSPAVRPSNMTGFSAPGFQAPALSAANTALTAGLQNVNIQDAIFSLVFLRLIGLLLC